MESSKCRLKNQGFTPGSCLVEADGRHRPACQVTLKYENGDIYRLITSVHLSRPENYLSILAFFPEHQMKSFRSPRTKEMVAAYTKVKSAGLQNIRLGNLGVFVLNEEDRDYLLANVDAAAL